MAAAIPSVRTAPARLGLPRFAAAAGLAAVATLAVALRFANFAAVSTTPYYDAAVRSMGLSWHNFLYGALEPSGQISVDKTPVDLWLQVASTKLFGFSGVSIRLPQAIAGVLVVLLVYGVVRRGYGRWAGIAAALAMAVLPSTVLTSRSDTMDTVMAALLVLAAWVIVRADPDQRARSVVIAGAVAGLAFEIKLSEATVALPALALLAWLVLDARRVRTLAWAGLAFVGVAASWAVVASLLPGRHPWPLGSTDGQIWNVLLDYNGVHRLGNPPTAATTPGPLRLFDTSGPRHFGQVVGVELLPALVFGALALAFATRGSRLQRAVGWSMGTWLLLGVLVASFMGRQWPRYLEAFTPALAAVLGIGIVAVGRAALRRRAATAALIACAAAAGLAGALTGGSRGATSVAVAVALAAAVTAAVAALAPARRQLVAVATALVVVAALVVPFATSVRLARAGTQDSEDTGTTPPAVLESLSAYLRAHQHGARYELAVSDIFKGAALIIKDAQPVLTLSSFGPRQLVSPAQLARAGRGGQVYYVLMSGARCLPGQTPIACLPVFRWVRAHGVDVSLAAGLTHRHQLYRLPAA
ncbi:MAG TPA: glycosyltransferase family 39 protein [Solirubrobacteraceae bacterium]|nr:glycosyltransferase family 39 protein [Solirubrobacteraceae bacterium]